MLTFIDLQNRVLRWIDEELDTDQTRNIVKDALNAVHRRLMGARSWPALIWHKEEAFTTTANQRFYALHPSMGKILNIWDVSGGQYLSVIPRRAWEGIGVNRSQTNVPPYGVSFGPVWPVKFQPSVVGPITAVSSDAGDMSRLILQGLDGSSEPIKETLILTGTTPVNTVQSFSHIQRVTSDGTITGTRTLRDNAAVTMLSLNSTQYAKQYPTLEFIENPEGGRSFTYTFSRQPDDLFYDYDVPNVYPNACAEILVYDALYDLVAYNTELGLKEQAIWRERRAEFYKQLLDANDEEIVGAYPKLVRDLEGGTPVRRVTN